MKGVDAQADEEAKARRRRCHSHDVAGAWSRSLSVTVAFHQCDRDRSLNSSAHGAHETAVPDTVVAFDIQSIDIAEIEFDALTFDQEDGRAGREVDEKTSMVNTRAASVDPDSRALE